MTASDDLAIPQGRRTAVVIACHNDGATLPETLASLNAQEECELVIVDDGSNDPDTLALMESLRAAGKLVLRQDQAGPAAARMTALRASSAPYVFALDADDLLAPGALTALADALDAHPDATNAWGDIEMFGAVSTRRRGPRALDPWLITYNDEFIGVGLIRREALLQSGGWRLRGAFESWDLLMTLCEHGATGVYVPHLMLRYRIRGDRRLGELMEHYGEIYADLRRQHESLFERRRENWLRSPAPWRTKLLFPIIDRLPFLSAYGKRRIGNVVQRPSGFLSTRLPGGWFRRVGGRARGRSAT